MCNGVPLRYSFYQRGQHIRIISIPTISARPRFPPAVSLPCLFRPSSLPSVKSSVRQVLHPSSFPAKRSAMSTTTTTARIRPDGTAADALADESKRPLPDPAKAGIGAAASPADAPAAAVARPLPGVKMLRRALGLTQEAFAARYRIPLGTLREWEQGRTAPDQPARAYLKVIACNPEWVSIALASEPSAHCPRTTSNPHPQTLTENETRPVRSAAGEPATMMRSGVFENREAGILEMVSAPAPVLRDATRARSSSGVPHDEVEDCSSRASGS
jgi:putative transcriptional regulator